MNGTREMLLWLFVPKKTEMCPQVSSSVLKAPQRWQGKDVEDKFLSRRGPWAVTQPQTPGGEGWGV